jgi:DnaJ-class molecular chaperone
LRDPKKREAYDRGEDEDSVGYYDTFFNRNKGKNFEDLFKDFFEGDIFNDSFFKRSDFGFDMDDFGGGFGTSIMTST